MRRSLRKSARGRPGRQPIDYRDIRLSPAQTAAAAATGVLLSAGCAFLFYRSFAAMLSAFIIVPVVIKRKTEKNRRAVRERLNEQFTSGMQAVSAALIAGYSMENALKSAREDVGSLYGKDAEFYEELTGMSKSLSMNIPVEKVFEDFAVRSGSEDICYFAEILRYAKRSGGSITEIIKETTDRIREKNDVLSEIETAAAAKRREQMMMTLLFPGVLLFITVSSPEYAAGLYHNAAGVMIMSISLAGYIAACMWAEKILDIRV